MSKAKTQNKTSNTYARLKVVGVGGAGGTMIDRLASIKIPAVEYIAVNTDVQALEAIKSPGVKKIRIGQSLTKGSGTGMDPELGRAAIEKSITNVENALKQADIIFIVAGMGGGTGSGAGPVIAELSKKTKAITVAVVTRPFAFEGAKRLAIAEQAFKKFENRVDGLVTISNNQILNITDKSSTLIQAFGIVDDILLQGVRTISDILTVPGLVNVDFSDIRTILTNAGSVLLGVGTSRGEARALNATKDALKNPLIENLSIKGATGVLFIVSGPDNLKMSEVDEIANVITQEVDSTAKIIFGAVIDEDLKDEIKVTIIASGFPSLSSRASGPVPIESEASQETISHQQQESFIDKTDSVVPGGTEPIKRELRDDQKIKTYGVDKEAIEQKLAEKEMEEIQLEEELEIPAFLRKKFK